MARVKPVHKASDYTGDPAEVAALFGTMFPGVENPAFDANHDGMAIAALNPKMAQYLAQTSRFMALDLGWCKRADLRELAIMTVNRHFESTYSIRSREAIALAGGISADQAAALPDWRNSSLFDAEQRLVIEYAQAVMTGTVPAAFCRSIPPSSSSAGASIAATARAPTAVHT